MVDSHLILILEPSGGDALMLEAAFEKQQLRSPARVLRNDFELRSYMNGAGEYANRELFPLPSLLLLDLSNAVSSLSSLRWLRQKGFSDQFLTIGLGKFSSRILLQRAFDLGMNGFFEKPNDVRALAKTIASLEWVDGWRLNLPEFAAAQHLTKEQFYLVAAS